MNRRTLQRLRFAHGPTPFPTTEIPAYPINPDSVVSRAIALSYRQRPTGNYGWHILVSHMDDVHREDVAYIQDGLRKVGYAEDEAAHWSSHKDIGLRFTRRDRGNLLLQADVFCRHGWAYIDAVDWWSRFTNPYHSLDYREAGRTSLHAERIFDWILPPAPTITFGHIDDTVLREAHAWTMSGIPLGRIRSYLDLDIDYATASSEWEPRAESEGYDIDAALSMLKALQAEPADPWPVSERSPS